jgi:hypothetical protein
MSPIDFEDWAASITPERLEFITDVGPPDWPINALPFDIFKTFY